MNYALRTMFCIRDASESEVSTMTVQTDFLFPGGVLSNTIKQKNHMSTARDIRMAQTLLTQEE